MLYENDKKMIKKYADVLDAVGKAYTPEMDMGIALSAMQAAYRNNTRENVHGVPECFDWEQFGKDMVECDYVEPEAGNVPEA